MTIATLLMSLTALHLSVAAPVQDPADSAYRAARNELTAGNYRRAADLFAELRTRFPRSSYVAASMYWQAYGLHRIGGMDRLREARTLLRQHQERHAGDATARQGRELLVTVQGDLARLGDAEAARAVAAIAEGAAPPTPVAAPGRVPAAAAPRPSQTPRPPAAVRPPRAPTSDRRPRNDGCDDDTEAMIALTALMNMRSEQAVPMLRRVLERRDAGSECLRRRAVFIVAQQRSAEVTALLLNAVRTDPDPEVREQGVFWLSQVNAPEAVTALDSILRIATDRTLQERAIFALSQQRSSEAGAALRRYLERTDTPTELRENVVFWLGQSRDPETSAYLRAYFTRTTDASVRERILFSLAQTRSDENAAWLVEVALDESQTTEIRKTAIFWAGQQRSFPIARLQTLYGQMRDREVREQIIFALSQRRDDAAVDALIAIARQEQDRELRRAAIFWLGQSNNPRAAEFLLELINQ